MLKLMGNLLIAKLNGDGNIIYQYGVYDKTTGRERQS